MNKDRAKSIIYLRTISVFLITYLILMLGFSSFLINQKKKEAGMELEAFGLRVNQRVENILQKHLDEEGQITDLLEVNSRLLEETPFFTMQDSELAIFTGEYKLLFNTNKYWRCSYTKYREGNMHYTADAYLNPEDWLDEKEIRELEGYLYADLKPKKVGDLAGYSLHLEGFWLDNDMVIPEKIVVQPMYAQKFDERGKLIASSGESTEELVFVIAGQQDTKDLPYFKYGGIIPENTGNPGSQKRTELRQLVTDQAKLRAAIDRFFGMESSVERVGFLTYRYYLLLPYQNLATLNDDEIVGSSFWTVLGREVNLGERCVGTLAFLWLSCLITFGIGALILAKQTYKTYRQQEELANQRREMTNALAHDLKTPLSVISGYAQNLQENVHTEKREYYASHIQANVQRMDQIIHQLLELTRLESAYLKISLEDVALEELAKTIIDRYKPLWEAKLITTSLEGKAKIQADPSLILRVIDNFFINALDKTPQGGSIRIKIYSDTLEVYNSGSHIPEDKLDEIWEPFKKGDESRSHSRGTGLGLAIVRRILELHQFTYGAKNSDDGVVFWFRF